MPAPLAATGFKRLLFAHYQVSRSKKCLIPRIQKDAFQIGRISLQLWELRKEVVVGGKMSDRQFHDLILAQNSIPIEMIRAAILKTPLERDHRAAWKFGGS